MSRTCFLLGLSVQDADDVAQDVWEWMIRSGRVSLAATSPWLSAVVKNFVKRLWRSRAKQASRERVALESTRGPAVAGRVEDVELRLCLDRLEAGLPGLEADLLKLMRSGESFAAAAARLAIPRGSRDYYRKRLAARLTAVVHPGPCIRRHGGSAGRSRIGTRIATLPRPMARHRFG